MTLTSHPKVGTTIKAEEMAEHFEKILSMMDRVSEDFTLTTSPSSLSGTLSPGKAYIKGYEVGEPGTDSDENLSFTASSTNHIFLDQNGVVTVNTTGTAPANSIKLFEATTDGTGVTGEVDVQDKVVEFAADLAAQSAEFFGNVFADSGVLSDVQPYLEFEDTSGSIYRLWGRNGKLQVTDQSGSTVHTDDLADIFGGSTFIDQSEKGAANGVTTLDGSGVHPAAEYRTATETTKGGVELADAAPPDIAQFGAKGVATDVARKDHTHAHGDRSGDGGTAHAMGQIGGTITDGQHGNRGGGALHSNATTGTAGFMSASDKVKLDGIESGATADQTDNEIFTAVTNLDGAGSGLDADLLDGQQGTHYLARANHTGTQASTTISDFEERTEDVVAGLVVGGNLITVTYDDGAGTLTFDVQEGAGSGLDADTLDGQQGSFYQNAANMNAGVLPVARLSGTYNISISGDAATLDGIDSASFLRSDTPDTFTANLTAAANILPDDSLNDRQIGSPSAKFGDIYAENVHTGDFWMSDEFCAVTGRLLDVGHRLGFKVIEVRHKEGVRELRTIPYIIQPWWKKALCYVKKLLG